MTNTKGESKNAKDVLYQYVRFILCSAGGLWKRSRARISSALRSLNNRLLRKLLADPAAYETVTFIYDLATHILTITTAPTPPPGLPFTGQAQPHARVHPRGHRDRQRLPAADRWRGRPAGRHALPHDLERGGTDPFHVRERTGADRVGDDGLHAVLLQQPLPTSNETWTRAPFTRKQFNELFRITPDMAKEEIVHENELPKAITSGCSALRTACFQITIFSARPRAGW